MIPIKILFRKIKRGDQIFFDFIFSENTVERQVLIFLSWLYFLNCFCSASVSSKYLLISFIKLRIFVWSYQLIMDVNWQSTLYEIWYSVKVRPVTITRNYNVNVSVYIRNIPALIWKTWYNHEIKFIWSDYTLIHQTIL